MQSRLLSALDSAHLIATGASTPVHHKGVVVTGALILAWDGQAGITLGLDSQRGGTCGDRNVSEERWTQLIGCPQSPKSL